MTPLRNVLTALAAATLIAMTTDGHAQGLIGLDNIYNTGSSTATTNGLFYVKTNGSSAVLIQQDFSVAFYAGSNSSSLSQLATFLTSDGTASGDNAAGAGTFLDPTGTAYTITNAANWGYFQVQAWFGSYSSYSAAASAGAYCGQSIVFSNSVASPPSTPPDLTLMPSVVLTAGGGGNSPLGGGGGGGASGGGPSPSSGGGGGSHFGPTGFDPGSTNLCGLWLSVAASNTTAIVTLHNTRVGETYLLWSTQVVSEPFTNWGLEASVVGAAGDTTQTNIAMNGRSDLFFRATEYSNTNTIFQGLGYADAKYPNPDSMGAVGDNLYIELLNGAVAVYDKSGVTITQTTMVNFFSVSYNGTNYPTAGQMSDPRLLYDSQSQRWIASANDAFGSHQTILAVSTNASPTNLNTGWKRYVLQVAQDGSATDFDTLGLDANGIYLSVLHAPSITNFHTVVAIKKPEIYNGTNISTTFKVSTNDLLAWTIQPAVNFDSVASNGYALFVAKGPPNLSSNYQGGALKYRPLQWSGTNAAWAGTGWVTISASTVYEDYYDLDGTNISGLPVTGISAPQTNGSVDLYDIGSRLAAATIRNGFLWTCQAIGLSTNTGTYVGDSSGSNVTRSAMQWLKLQISPDGSSLSLADHGRVYDSSQKDNPWWYYFPSLTVNSVGDMVAGFSGSTATNYMGAFYTWRLSCGAVLSQPALIQAGTTNGPSRAGDYSATTLDPTDDSSFWTVQEYATNSLFPNRWGTVVAKVRPKP